VPEGQVPVKANMLPVFVHLGLVLWLGLSIPPFLAHWLDQATELITGSHFLYERFDWLSPDYLPASNPTRDGADR
jgi:hypothetical protein